MKLFWKNFLSIITVAALVFCIGGHILIYSFFNLSLKNAVDYQAEANWSFCRSFQAALERTVAGNEPSERDVVRAAGAVKGVEGSQITILDENKNVLFIKTQKDMLKFDEKLLEKVQNGTAGYRIKKGGAVYNLYLTDKVSIEETNYYVERVSDITDIFQQKTMLYRIFGGIMIGLIIVLAGVVFLLTQWIVRPVQELSRAAKEIGEGDYEKSIHIHGQDEISELAEEFNRMAERVKDSMDELQEAARRQEEFVGSFSHELKTPLTSIIGYSDMLRSKKLTEEEQIIYGDYIFRQGKRLEILSRKMQELTVLGKKDFRMRNVSLENMFETLQDEMRPMLEKKGISMKYFAEDVDLMAEPDLLRTVFVNLIDNSAKAIEQDGSIVLRAAQECGKTVVSVSDNGKGIPKKDIERVTERFYMADKSRKHEGGVGLGLSICKKILDLHHAEMKIFSTEGTGTEVIICFRGHV